jgi:hypothetical protein
LLAVRFRSAHTAHMSDVIVDKDEWWKLADELYGIRDDAGTVNSFMVKHASTKWKVGSARVGLFVEFARIRMVVQRNGAPVWLVSAALCDKNVLQWLAAKGIKPPVVDSYVRHCAELGIRM